MFQLFYVSDKMAEFVDFCYFYNDKMSYFYQKCQI